MSNFPILLKLKRQPNGLYTLIATVISPDNCHFATKPIPGRVFGQPVENDLIPIVLPMVSPLPPSQCEGVPKTLTYRIPNIRISPSLPKKGVKAFLVINPGLTLLDTATVRIG